MIKYTKYLILILLAYFYIYNPILRVAGFGLIKIILALGLLYIVAIGATRNVINLYRKEITFTLLLSGYMFISTFYPNGDGEGYLASYRHVVWALEGFIIPYYIIHGFGQYLRNQTDLNRLVVIVSTIAALISLFLILNPDINMAMRQNIIVDGLDDYDVYRLNHFRGFSFADGSSMAYGVVQGMIIIICIFMMKQSYLYAIPPAFIMVSIMFNARTGYVPIIIGIMIYVFKGSRKYRTIIALAIVGYIGYYVASTTDILSNYTTTIEWTKNFFKYTSEFIRGDQLYSDNTYKGLLDGLVIPEKLSSLFIGEGRDIFRGVSTIGYRSDIGYIVQIHKGGLIYLLIMLMFLQEMYHRYVRSSDDRTLVLMFFFTLLIVNVKGDAFFSPSAYSRLFTLYYVYSIISRNAKAQT